MSNKQYVTSKYVRDRYGVSDMTLWRWLRDPKLNFPKPLTIRRRNLWVPEELDAFDARQRGEAA